MSEFKLPEGLLFRLFNSSCCESRQAYDALVALRSTVRDWQGRLDNITADIDASVDIDAAGLEALQDDMAHILEELGKL